MLRARLLPADRPGAWRTLWADQDAAGLAAAVEDLASPPLFGGPGILAVRHADALTEADQERLLAVLPTLGAGGCLVLVARGKDTRRRLFAACVKAGAAHLLAALDERAAAAWVVRLARDRGHEIASPATQELIDRSGFELGVLAGEIEKLALAAGSGRRIEPGHVRAVVADVRAHEVQELTDRLAQRDLAGAARALRRLLAEGEPAIRVVAFVAANLRRTLHVAELAESGLGPDAIAQRLGMPPWLVAKTAGRGRAADLIRALDALRRLDLELKSSRPTEAVFEDALLRIAG